MNSFAIRAIGTKAEHVVFTDYLLPVLVKELTILVAQLAETLLVVRTWLLLLCCADVFRFWMSVDALLLDVTMSVLLKELANWNSVLNPPMQVFA